MKMRGCCTRCISGRAGARQCAMGGGGALPSGWGVTWSGPLGLPGLRVAGPIGGASPAVSGTGLQPQLCTRPSVQCDTRTTLQAGRVNPAAQTREQRPGASCPRPRSRGSAPPPTPASLPAQGPGLGEGPEPRDEAQAEACPAPAGDCGPGARLRGLCSVGAPPPSPRSRRDSGQGLSEQQRREVGAQRSPRRRGPRPHLVMPARGCGRCRPGHAPRAPRPPAQVGTVASSWSHCCSSPSSSPADARPHTCFLHTPPGPAPLPVPEAACVADWASPGQLVWALAVTRMSASSRVQRVGPGVACRLGFSVESRAGSVCSVRPGCPGAGSAVGASARRGPRRPPGPLATGGDGGAGGRDSSPRGPSSPALPAGLGHPGKGSLAMTPTSGHVPCRPLTSLDSLAPQPPGHTRSR